MRGGKQRKRVTHTTVKLLYTYSKEKCCSFWSVKGWVTTDLVSCGRGPVLPVHLGARLDISSLLPSTFRTSHRILRRPHPVLSIQNSVVFTQKGVNSGQNTLI